MVTLFAAVGFCAMLQAVNRTLRNKPSDAGMRVILWDVFGISRSCRGIVLRSSEICRVHTSVNAARMSACATGMARLPAASGE
jgi:hypothetical protein